MVERERNKEKERGKTKLQFFKALFGAKMSHMGLTLEFTPCASEIPNKKKAVKTKAPSKFYTPFHVARIFFCPFSKAFSPDIRLFTSTLSR